MKLTPEERERRRQWMLDFHAARREKSGWKGKVPAEIVRNAAVCRDSVYRRLRAGWTLEKALRTPSRRHQIVVDGARFATIAEACAAFDVHPSVVSRRMKSGEKVGRRLFRPAGKAGAHGREFSVGGQTFPSRAAAARAYGFREESDDAGGGREPQRVQRERAARQRGGDPRQLGAGTRRLGPGEGERGPGAGTLKKAEDGGPPGGAAGAGRAECQAGHDVPRRSGGRPDRRAARPDCRRGRGDGEGDGPRRRRSRVGCVPLGRLDAREGALRLLV